MTKMLPYTQIMKIWFKFRNSHPTEDGETATKLFEQEFKGKWKSYENILVFEFDNEEDITLFVLSNS